MTRSHEDLMRKILKVHTAIVHLNEAMGILENARLELDSLALDTMALEALHAQVAQWMITMTSWRSQMVADLMRARL